MSSRSKAACCCLLLALLADVAEGQRNAQRVSGSPIFAYYYQPYNSVGLVDTRVGGMDFRGSAAVARDSRLLYSCAHLVYDYGRGWASRFAFKRAYNGFNAPPSHTYVAARGYRVLEGYAPDASFDLDFAVAYGGARRYFGPALSINANPLGAVTGSAQKLIVGYPSDLDHSPWYDTGYYYMHQTGPFASPFVDDDIGPSGHYVADWITTGSGNSGGPVMVWNTDSSRYELAGILVSGSDYNDELWFAGVYVLGSESSNAASDALGLSESGVSNTRHNYNQGWIKNASAAYARRFFDFRNAPPQTMQVNLDLNISTGRRGDIDAFVRSPGGRVRIVAWRNSADTGADVLISGENITGGLLYANARGIWSLYFRDVLPGNPSWFGGASLHLRSRWSN